MCCPGQSFHSRLNQRGCGRREREYTRENIKSISPLSAFPEVGDQLSRKAWRVFLLHVALINEGKTNPDDEIERRKDEIQSSIDYRCTRALWHSVSSNENFCAGPKQHDATGGDWE